MVIYIVKSGDTLYSIGRQFGVTVAELERYNGFSDPNRLVVGQDVLIPIEGSTYTVQSGDSLYSIASSFGLNLNELLRANPNLQPPYTIYPNQAVNIPENAQKRTVSVNG